MAKGYSRGFKRARIVVMPDWFCEGCQKTHPGLRDRNQSEEGNDYCNLEFHRLFIRLGGATQETIRAAQASSNEKH